MKKMKRAIALLLASIMVAASPMTALAEEEAAVVSEVAEEQVSENVVSALDGIAELQEKYHVDFAISSEMMVKKAALAATLDKLSTCTPDEDYTDKQIVVLADSEEEAEEIAEGFEGKVVAF